MSEITVHTGTQGDETTIHVDWFDENNMRRRTDVEFNILHNDKPRVLEIKVNGVALAYLPTGAPNIGDKVIRPGDTMYGFARALDDAILGAMKSSERAKA